MNPPRADLRAIGRFVRDPRVGHRSAANPWSAFLCLTFFGDAKTVTALRGMSALVTQEPSSQKNIFGWYQFAAGSARPTISHGVHGGAAHHERGRGCAPRRVACGNHCASPSTMWSSFLDTLHTQLQNQVVAGGIALGLAGILVAALRKVPGMLWAQLQRLVVVATAVIDSRNDIFNAYVAWLNDLPFGRKSRLFTVVQAPPDPGDTVGTLPRLVVQPGAGMHVFWHDGHVMWIERTIAMNLQVVETIRVSMLFARRARLEAMLADVIAQPMRGWPDAQLFTVDQWGTGWRLADAKAAPAARLGGAGGDIRASGWWRTSRSSSTVGSGMPTWAFRGGAAICSSVHPAPARRASRSRWRASCSFRSARSHSPTRSSMTRASATSCSARRRNRLS